MIALSIEKESFGNKNLFVQLPIVMSLDMTF